MEAWRIELYNSFSHSVEGSTWKDHKYVAIVNGRYIYPEDLEKEKENKSGIIIGATKISNAGSSASSQSTESSNNTSVNPNSITYTDRGSVKSYKYLPDNPTIGDVYLLEDTKQKVFWNGEIWTPYTEPEKPKSTGTKVGGSGGKKTEEISDDTVDRVRRVAGSTLQLNSKKTVKLNPDSGVSSISGSSQVSKGKNAISMSSIVQNAVSSIKNSKLYQAGSKIVNKLFGKTTSTVKMSSSKGARR